MNKYRTITLTARVEGDELVLMTNDGVVFARKPMFLCEPCTDEAIAQAEWWEWTADAVRSGAWAEIKSRIDDKNGPGWGRKVEAWIAGLRNRMKAERRRSQGPSRKKRRYRSRKPYEPKGAQDWFEATRTMWNIIEAERKRANDSEWKRWAESVTNNHRRKHGSAAAQ